MFDLQGTIHDLIQRFSSLPQGLNWLDYVIIFVFLLYGFEGFGVGFLAGIFDFISFCSSFLLGLKLYNLVGNFFSHQFSLSIGIANALAFFAVAFVSEIILSILLRRLFHYLYTTFAVRTVVRKREDEPQSVFHLTNHLLGIIPGIASAYILLAFLLSLIIALPFSPNLKKTIVSSSFGSKLVANTQGVEQNLNTVFGGALQETLTFLTVQPQSNEFVNLNFKISSVSPDKEAEAQMFQMVNSERIKRGIQPLEFDTALQDVARVHSKDMFERGYFSHYTPEGKSPFDRMNEAGIMYQYAGENLALAPSTELAMQGLMESKGHRDNMLSPRFGKIGIGVIDGGIYGKMFSQEFRD